MRRRTEESRWRARGEGAEPAVSRASPEIDARNGGDAPPLGVAPLARRTLAACEPIPSRVLKALAAHDDDAWRSFIAMRGGFVRQAAARAMRDSGASFHGATLLPLLDDARQGVWLRLCEDGTLLTRYAGKPGFLLKRLAQNSVRGARRGEGLPKLGDRDPADRRDLRDPAVAASLRDEVHGICCGAQAALRALSDRDRRILQARFGSRRSLNAIASSEGCGTSRACALVTRASTRFLGFLRSRCPAIPSIQGKRRRGLVVIACLSILDRTRRMAPSLETRGPAPRRSTRDPAESR